PVSPSKTVSPSVAAAKLSALNNKRDSTARAGERGGEEANASSGTSSTPRADGVRDSVGDNVDAVDINARSENSAGSADAESAGADDNHEDANSEGASVGLRQRILQPSPPAPVPELKK